MASSASSKGCILVGEKFVQLHVRPYEASYSYMHLTDVASALGWLVGWLVGWLIVQAVGWLVRESVRDRSRLSLVIGLISILLVDLSFTACLEPQRRAQKRAAL